MTGTPISVTNTPSDYIIHYTTLHYKPTLCTLSHYLSPLMRSQTYQPLSHQYLTMLYSHPQTHPLSRFVVMIAPLCFGICLYVYKSIYVPGTDGVQKVRRPFRLHDGSGIFFTHYLWFILDGCIAWLLPMYIEKVIQTVFVCVCLVFP